MCDTGICGGTGSDTGGISVLSACEVVITGFSSGFTGRVTSVSWLKMDRGRSTGLKPSTVSGSVSNPQCLHTLVPGIRDLPHCGQVICTEGSVILPVTSAGISSVFVGVTVAGTPSSAGFAIMSDDLSKPHCIQNLAPGSNGVPHCGQKFIVFTFRFTKLNLSVCFT